MRHVNEPEEGGKEGERKEVKRQKREKEGEGGRGRGERQREREGKRDLNL